MVHPTAFIPVNSHLNMGLLAGASLVTLGAPLLITKQQSIYPMAQK